MLLKNLRIGIKRYSDIYNNNVKYRRIDYNTGEIHLYPFWHKPLWILIAIIENKEKFVSCKLINYINNKLLP